MTHAPTLSLTGHTHTHTNTHTGTDDGLLFLQMTAMPPTGGDAEKQGRTARSTGVVEA